MLPKNGQSNEVQIKAEMKNRKKRKILPNKLKNKQIKSIEQIQMRQQKDKRQLIKMNKLDGLSTA